MNKENAYDLANGLPKLLKNELQDAVLVVNPFDKNETFNDYVSEKEKKLLTEYVIKIGKAGKVSVFVGKERNGFDTQINIQGDLEQNEEFSDCFRIVTYNSSYCYFKIENIIGVFTKKDKFNDDSVAVIKIKI